MGAASSGRRREAFFRLCRLQLEREPRPLGGQLIGAVARGIVTVDQLAEGMVIGFMTIRAAGGRRLGRPWREIPRRDRLLISASAATNAALNLAMFIAFLRIGIALALLLFYIYPALVALTSVTWFGERLDRLRWAARRSCT